MLNKKANLLAWILQLPIWVAIVVTILIWIAYHVGKAGI